MIKYLLICLLAVVIVPMASAQILNSHTQLVLLGTGTPNAEPTTSGPSLAIIVNNASYVVDCGPGVVRRAAEAKNKGIASLAASKLKRLFITHLHSDHTIGYPDFILTPAVLERNEPLEVYGPKGLQSMTDHILAAYKEDIDIRIHGLEYGNAVSYKVNAHEIKEGTIYKDSNLVVKAFKVNHGSWPDAFGYRFETKDKVIVVSGDCTYSENLIANAKDCDILVHEVYSMEGFARRDKKWQAYHSVFHTSTQQLAEIANKVKPKQLVLTHQLLWGASKESMLNEIQLRYKGKVVYGNDLDIFD
jgi:ribonuclease Z